MSRFLECFENSKYSELIKIIEEQIQAQKGSVKAVEHHRQLYFNRGWCYQQLDLNRKALKDYNEAIKMGRSDAKVHLHRGQALWAMDKTKVYIKPRNSCEVRAVWIFAGSD